MKNPGTGFVVGLGIVAALAVFSNAQDVDPARFAEPPVDNWLTYHGDYSGKRHSPLTQINAGNLDRLTEVWRFDTGQPPSIKGTPVLVDGVLYVTTPDNLWAVDARTAEELWHYTYPMNDAFHIGHRGVAVHGDNVYLTTPDGRTSGK